MGQVLSHLHSGFSSTTTFAGFSLTAISWWPAPPPTGPEELVWQGQCSDSFPMLATAKRISVNRRPLFSLRGNRADKRQSFYRWLKPGCSCGNVVAWSRWRRIEIDASFSSLVVSHDCPEVNPYFQDISNSPVYLVIFAAHSVPGAFPAGSDDFSKSPLRRTMSSTQSGHYHSALTIHFQNIYL